MVNYHDSFSWILIGTGKIACSYAEAISFLFKDDKFFILPKSKESLSYKIFSSKFNNFISIDFNDIKNLENPIPIICTPVESHIRIILKLLENNIKEIYSEKPLSMNINEINKLIGHKEKIFTLYNRRFYETQNYLRKIKSNIININAKISLNDKDSSFRQNFLPHFLDFIFYSFPKNNQFKINKSTEFIEKVSYLSKDSQNNIFPVDITIIKNSILPCSIEVIYRDYRSIFFNTLEELHMTKHNIKKTKNLTNKFYISERKTIKEENYTKKNIKYGFIEMLTSIRNKRNKKMQTIYEAIEIANLIKSL